MRRPSSALLVLLLAATAVAGPGPTYRYGEQWWDEYASDRATELLLHFGPPQVAGHAATRAAVDQRQRDELLVPDLAELTAKPDQNPLGDLRAPPVDEAALPAGTLADYSEQRRRLALPAGFSVTPAGRFGGGLTCAGTGVFAIPVGNVESAEAWVQVAAYPAGESCLLALGDDDARLLLRPDGRLELRLKHPHGRFDEARTSPAAQAAILARPADLIAPAPLPPAAWTHVLIRKVRHPMPGGGEPWEAQLVVDGETVAAYQSERYNLGGDFFGRQRTTLRLGNSAAGGQGFVGTLDQVRVSNAERVFYTRPPLPWRDAAASRPLQFDRPWFRADATALHLPFEGSLAPVRGAAAPTLELKGAPLTGLLVEGIRGQALRLDSTLGHLRVPLDQAGLSLRQGTLECWLRPVNFDDVTGYWHHSPPKEKTLSVLRLIARDPATGQEVPWLDVGLDRAHNLERQRLPLDPGHWLHLTLVWREGDDGKYQSWLWVNGEQRLGVKVSRDRALAGLVPAYAEFGVATPVTVKHDEPPRIELDEVVAYRVALEQDEARQAMARWQGELAPIPLFQASFQYKYSLHKLQFALRPLLPEGVAAARATVALLNADGQPVRGPLTLAAPEADGQFRAVLGQGEPLPYGTYRFTFAATDAAGTEVLRGTRDWDFAAEPWRGSRAGILDTVPPPWTPIAATGDTYATRMTRYELAADGLPVTIVADGVPLLAGPVRLLANGQPLTGAPRAAGATTATAADWRGEFRGQGVTVQIAWHLEYDGMLRWELRLRPDGAALPTLQLDLPVRADLATHALWYPVGDRGVKVRRLPETPGPLLTSKPADRDGFGFWAHCDLNNRDRGLWWFADNAAGWVQSPTVPALAMVREGDAVVLRLNLVAEATATLPDRPIVFALLPHPARPLPAKYRLFERVKPADDPRACSIFDAFMPWPVDPRTHSMKLYPAPDPRQPAAGPSWAYAESCIPSMKAAKPVGYRTMYLSRLWFSCRAGAYDNWEWRSGESMGASLTPAFVDYLCWEMNEWLGRGIFDAIYLDECYEIPARNLEAGLSVRLPDGSEQPGVTNFAFRELMQRWRQLFHAHGLEPMIMGHHTFSFQYPGLLYCDAILDGENYPIVSLTSKDWIDSVGLVKYEVTQSARQWGVAPFWMPFVAEGGFENKEKSQFPRWQWRMARQAQSVFAHFEIGTVYEGQGKQVYQHYWQDALAWGAGDPAAVAFVPYWQAAPALTVAGQGQDVLASYYRAPGKLLLIVSNRTQQPQTLRLTLDRAALGLGAAPAVRDVDSGAQPPPGEDFVKDGPKPKPEAAGMGPEEPELELEDAAAKAAAAAVPRWEGNTLIVPVRPRDFRLLAVE